MYKVEIPIENLMNAITSLPLMTMDMFQLSLPQSCPPFIQNDPKMRLIAEFLLLVPHAEHHGYYFLILSFHKYDVCSSNQGINNIV